MCAAQPAQTAKPQGVSPVTPAVNRQRGSQNAAQRQWPAAGDRVNVTTGEQQKIVQQLYNVVSTRTVSAVAPKICVVSTGVRRRAAVLSVRYERTSGSTYVSRYVTVRAACNACTAACAQCVNHNVKPRVRARVQREPPAPAARTTVHAQYARVKPCRR